MSVSSPFSLALAGKVAAVTGAASGIGYASALAMFQQGATVIFIDRDKTALQAIQHDLGERCLILVIDLLDRTQCAAIADKIFALTEQLDIFHANAGLYVGGDLIDAELDAIDNMMELNVNVVMKNVRCILPHMIERGVGDIVVTSSLAAHYPTPWEPVYASSKWAIDCFVQTTRRQVYKHGIRVGAISPGPVVTGLLKDWPQDKLEEQRALGGLIEPEDVAEVILFTLTRPRHMTIRDVVVMPSFFDL